MTYVPKSAWGRRKRYAGVTVRLKNRIAELEAELAKERLRHHHDRAENDDPDLPWVERDHAIARAEKAEAEVERLKEGHHPSTNAIANCFVCQGGGRESGGPAELDSAAPKEPTKSLVGGPAAANSAVPMICGSCVRCCCGHLEHEHEHARRTRRCRRTHQLTQCRDRLCLCLRFHP